MRKKRQTAAHLSENTENNMIRENWELDNFKNKMVRGGKMQIALKNKIFEKQKFYPAGSVHVSLCTIYVA